MNSSWFCPTCARRLREMKAGGGGIEPGRYECRLGHGWEIRAASNDPQDWRVMFVQEVAHERG